MVINSEVLEKKINQYFNNEINKTDLGLSLIHIFTYDGLGNLLSVTDGEGNTTSYRYDELHRMTAITDGNGAVTRFAYDGAVPVSYTLSLIHI